MTDTNKVTGKDIGSDGPIINPPVFNPTDEGQELRKKLEWLLGSDIIAPAGSKSRMIPVKGLYKIERDLQITRITDYILANYVPKSQATAAQERAVAETEKAYGGCRNRYGKGYATINDRWVAHDTDQDIGSPGGYVVGGKDFKMKFCNCERGKQLGKLLTPLPQVEQEQP